MGIADEVRASSAGMPKTHKWPFIIEQLGSEGPELEGLIGDPSVRPIAIWKALRDRGFDISNEAVNAKCRKARGQ